MDKQIKTILAYLHTTRGMDFSTSRYFSLERKINQRLIACRMTYAGDYIRFLEDHPEELTRLIDLLTVNVSHFFRNPLTYEMLAKQVLPELLIQKSNESSPSLRIWSAGCASGEEPYSIAILIQELLRKEEMAMDVRIFATDINQSVLKSARKGRFTEFQLYNVTLGILNRYFNWIKGDYYLDQQIKEMVSFSHYDIIDPKTYVPPESVFGNFDIVLCRNVLIYFQNDRQAIIFNKLFRSLSSHGYLVLGEAERLPETYQYQFKKNTDYCHIYRKIQ